MDRLTPYQMKVLNDCTYEDETHIHVNKLGKERKAQFLQLREAGLLETHPDQPYAHRRLPKGDDVVRAFAAGRYDICLWK